MKKNGEHRGSAITAPRSHSFEILSVLKRLSSSQFVVYFTVPTSYSLYVDSSYDFNKYYIVQRSLTWHRALTVTF
jgi:hypothetical protein